MSENPIVLPIATVQTDFESLIDDVFSGLVPEDKFWLSCYKSGEQSVHGKVHLSLNERDRNLVDLKGDAGVEFTKIEGDYTATCTSLGISQTHLAVPASTFADFLPRTHHPSYHAISAFDIAPDGSQFAVGYGDGTVYIVPTTSTPSAATSVSKAHLNAITSLQFFPSSRVLLTAGVDFSLTILSADPAPPHADQQPTAPTRVTPVRTLKGHSRAVTSTAIISRGRNVLTASKDGTVRLWDVSSGSQIRMMGAAKYAGVFSMSAGDRGATVSTQSPDGEGVAAGIPLSVDPREVDTQDKLAFCGLADGTFELFDLGSKLSVFHSANKSAGALQSIAYSAEYNMLATGSGTGVVRVYDTRSLATPLVAFQRNAASIEDVAFVPSGDGARVDLAIATEDGLPYVAHVRPEGPSVRAELVGTDCDATRRVRVRGGTGEIWLAGDDGVVRKYDALRS